MLVTLPEHIPALLNKIPEEDQPRGEQEAKFWRLVAYELGQLLYWAARAASPQVVFNEARQSDPGNLSGHQWIWEFWVNDLALPKNDRMNWHGQPTSQWLYAGAILWDTNRKEASHHH